MENFEENVELTVNADDWPHGLAGLHIPEQMVYVKDGKVVVNGDPIWRVE